MPITRDEIIAELVDKHGWSRETLEVWENAGFRCEYCGADLLRSVDEYFYGSHRDHIVPESRGGPTSTENLALCCNACNRLKRDRSFAVTGKPRDSIPTIKAFIEQARAEKQQQLQRVRELIDQLKAAGS